VRPGPESSDGLGEHVRARVTNDLATELARRVTMATLAPAGNGAVRSVNWRSLGREASLESFADGAREIQRRGALGQRAPTAVGQFYFDVRHFGHSLSMLMLPTR